MIVRVLLRDAFRDRIVREARDAVPRECCGLLEGVVDEETALITAVHPTRNLAEEPDRFEIDPAEQIRLLRQLRGTGREIIGCYHSHPNGRAEPSPRDREGAFGEGFLWLIAALPPGKRDGPITVGAFAFVSGSFRAVAPAPVPA